MINIAIMVRKGAASETLADYVKRVRRESRLSLNAVRDRSGGGISNAHVSKIENGYTISVSPLKLRALARGLGVPYIDLARIAFGPDTDDFPDIEKTIFADLYEAYLNLADQADKDYIRNSAEVLLGWMRDRRQKAKADRA